ncbi:MAG TPA: sialidase family protein [Candidatus Eisenbacteria bacterium]|nr:sialidase family protein [Candidatus Eisenbacteria bacterium]
MTDIDETDKRVTAIGWSPYNEVVYVSTVSSGSDATPRLWKSDDDGQNFEEITDHGLSSGTRPIKIIVRNDEEDEEGGLFVYLLSGCPQGFNGLKQLWRTADGIHFGRLGAASGGGYIGSSYVIDVAVSGLYRASGAHVVVMTLSDNPPGGNDDVGRPYLSLDGGSTWNMIKLGVDTTNTSGVGKGTGAIWFDDDGDGYLINVQRDVSSASTTSCGSSPPALAGKFHATSSDNWASYGNVSWARIDDGLGNIGGTDPWELGWANCEGARGRVFDNVANTLSEGGQYWVTPKFVWRYTTSGDTKYENAFTAISSSTYQSKGIDNANPWVVALGNDNATVWAGYHDLGIWKSTDDGDTWSNMNPNLGTYAGYGGNCSSILVSGGDTLFAVLGGADDPDPPTGYNYVFNIYRSVNSGGNWTPIGGLDPGFFYSLHKNSTTGRMWVTRNGRPYASDDKGSSWFLVDSTNFPTDGLYVVTTVNGVVMAGGWAGLWRSSDHGSNWAQIGTTSPTSNFDFTSDKGDVAHLERMKWHGIHQIMNDEYLWVVSYAGDAYSGSKNKGVWRSADVGASFPSSAFMDSTLRRGVAVDSCSRRVHITSGAAHNAGTNDSDELDHASGKLTCRLDGSAALASKVVEAAGQHYRYRFGGSVVTSANNYAFVCVPGYGLMRQTLPSTFPPEECQTEFQGGGGMRAARSREEVPRMVEPSVLRIADARERVLFDLSGRKVKASRPGVYFEQRLIGTRVARRTVIVVP